MEGTPSISTASGVVARGDLDDFSTVAVLQALSITRQFTAVDFYREDGECAGRVLLKSGMILTADLAGGNVRGIEALRSLLEEPLASFQVERLNPPADYPTPIAELSTELLSALSQPSPATSEPPPVPPVAAADPGPSATADESSASSRQMPVPEAGPRVEAAPGRPAPVVAVASPKGGSGKTTIALNLAVSLAGAGLRVVLVDSDPNGDVLSAVGARERVRSGIYDLLQGDADPTPLMKRTVVDGLVLLPALGHGSDLPDSLLGSLPDRSAWKDVFRRLSASADLVLVDTAAGMFGASAAVVAACSHVLGVLQAETIPRRSFGMLDRALRSMSDPPEILGVVLNMLRRSHEASLGVLMDASSEMAEDRLFHISIPRSDFFLEASVRGAPIAHTARDTAGIALLFDTLAAEVISRLELKEPSTRSKATSFLL